MTTPDKAKRLIEQDGKNKDCGTCAPGASEIAQAYLQEREARMLLEKEIQYFVDRAEDNHPDGYIRSRRTYGRYKEALSQVQKMGLT